MNIIKRTIPALVIAMIVISSLTVGYAANPKTDNDTVSVKKQVCYLKDYTHIQKNDSGLGIIADLPVKGPKTLIDSVNLYLNEQLYEYFDYDENNHHLPFEKVFSTNIQNLLKHYRKAYKPYFDVHNPEICEFGTHFLELNLVAQTETYITYECIHAFYSEGLEESRYWVTFAMSDGHRLKEVITTDNLARYLREHPEINDDGVLRAIGDCLANNENFSRAIRAGLLNDKLALQFIWAPGIYDDSQYDLTPLKPYLSAEAQSLINGK